MRALMVACRASSAGRRERHVHVPECRQLRPRHAREATTSMDEADARAVRGSRLRRGRGLARRRGRVFHSELPRPKRTRPGSDPGHVLAGRLAAFFDGAAGRLRRCALRPATTTGSTATARARSGACRAGEVVTYGELAALAGRPGRRARRRHVLRALRARAVPAGAPRRRRRRDRQLGRRSASTTSGGCWSSRMLRSLTTCATSSRRSRRRAAAAVIAELSALFHASGAWHLRGGRVAVHLDLASSAAARRAFALLRDLGVRSEIRTYRRRAFDQATRYQLHVDVDARALDVLREAGVLSPSGAPLEHPPKRVVGRSCCRGAYLRGALLGARLALRPARPAPRAPHERHRRRALHRRGRSARGCGARRRASGGRTRSPTRRATRRSPTCSRSPARVTPRCGSRSTRSSPRRAPTRTGSRTPTRRTSCAPRAPRTRSSRRSARSASTRFRPTRRDRRAAAAPPVGVAPRARREGAPAAHEGGRPSPAAGDRRSLRKRAYLLATALAK